MAQIKPAGVLKMRFIGVLTILLSAVAPLFAGSADSGIRRTPDRLNSVLATVNGEPVSLGDVLPLTQAKEYQAASAYSGSALERAVYDLRLAAVDELIDHKLIIADYESRAFEIPEREIESALDEVSVRMGCRSRSELAKKLRESGSSLKAFRSKIREQLIVQLMLYREYNASNFITPEDLRSYYREHEAEFSRPESVELAMLQLPAERNDAARLAEDISAALAASPETFADLVRRYSSGPGRGDGGKLGAIERRRLRAEFAEALGAVPETGRVYGPIKTADGVFWLRVLAYFPAEKRPFESSGAEIRRRLEVKLRRESRERYCARLRKGAIVRYFIPGVSETPSPGDVEKGK